MKGLGSIRRLTIVLIPLAVLGLMLGAFACTGKETTPAVAPGTSSSISASMPIPTSTAVATPMPPTSTTTAAALFLRVTSPEDESTVSTSSIQVTGSTIAGAVVSVTVNDNTQMADVDQSGNFQVTVLLEEGPNQIDVVASDQQGNEQSSTVTVMMYAP